MWWIDSQRKWKILTHLKYLIIETPYTFSSYIQLAF